MMKKMIKTILLFGMMSLPIASYGAGGESKVKIEVSGAKMFNLVLSNISYNLKVQIKDQSGYVLYKDNFNGSKINVKKYDLGILPEGDYFLEIEDDTRIKVHAIQVLCNEILISKTDVQEIFKPVIRERGNKFDVTLLSLDKSPLKIAVHDQDNNLVVKETLSGKISLGKTFDFSNLKKGNYVFYLRNSGRKYSKFVTIK